MPSSRAVDPRLTGDARLQPVLSALEQRSYLAAEGALTELPSEVRRTPAWMLLRGAVLTQLGRIEEAAEVLHPLTLGPEPWASEGAAALADALHLSQQHAALVTLLAQVPAWAATPRGRLFEARLLIRSDPAQALAMLMEIVDGVSGNELRRIAGFDAVKLLDRQACYREAHALATRLHALAPPFELNNFVAHLRVQQRLLAKGAGWCPPRTNAVDGTAFVVGLPRSGTTLLEQMLDAHPEVSGIGEHEGVSELAKSVVSGGFWPYRMAHLGADSASAMQRRYVDSARRRMDKPSARWTLDKSLLTWQWLPVLSAVMPGAVALRVMRDPRDMAISAFLSPLDAQAFGWVAGFDSLRQVIAAERELVPQALQTLGLAHETIVYEDLVANPAAAISPLVGRLGLDMDARVLSPEGNARTAVTLSHEQVRQPINDSSIGRWLHYDFAFGSEWDGLAAAHDAARRRPSVSEGSRGEAEPA